MRLCLALALCAQMTGCASYTEIFDREGRPVSRTLALGAPRIERPEGPHAVRIEVYGVGAASLAGSTAGGAGVLKLRLYLLGDCHASFRVPDAATALAISEMIGPLDELCTGVEE